MTPRDSYLLREALKAWRWALLQRHRHRYREGPTIIRHAEALGVSAWEMVYGG